MKFEQIELKDYVKRALADLKFVEATPIQESILEEYKSQKHLVGRSKTGSGKTHAFLLPIFNDLDENLKTVQACIIAPTTELAMQIYKVTQHIASFCSKQIDVKLYCGGTDRLKEISKLQGSQPQIVIGTPGKLKDLAITENVLKLYTSKFLIVDEMDMILSGGYEEDLDSLASIMKNAQIMCFSATMSEVVEQFIRKYLSNPKMIDIVDEITTIKHIWIPLKHKDRLEMLFSLMGTFQPYFAIIFANKKETVIELAKKLSDQGYFVGVMHGDLSIRERKRILNDCKNLKYQYLVATDLAARGLDIEGVSHIINYELPRDYEFYLHRSGRTGRMFYDGIVYSFYEEVDDEYLDSLSSKKIKPEYFEIKNGELLPYKGRNTRAERVKPQTEYYKQAAKYVPKPKKVSPGYKKKRQAQIEEIAQKLKKNHKKRRYYK